MEAGVALHETIETLLKYGKADADFTYYETRTLAAAMLPPPKQPIVLHHNPSFDAELMKQQLLTRFPQVKHYYQHMGIDTETHLLEEPIYCNQVYGRADGRFCITKNLIELSPNWIYETWCGDRIDQRGWDASKKVPTCITCIARRRG